MSYILPFQPTVPRCQRFASKAVLACCAALLMAGCAVTQETKQSLAAYVQAMAQVEASANRQLDDFAQTLRLQDQLAEPDEAGSAAVRRPAPEYPDEFIVGAPKAGAAETEGQRRIAATREALKVVHQYNDALVALAEGHSEAEIRSRATRFGSSLTSLASLFGQAIPGLGPLLQIGPKILKLAQDAANREQLKQAVEQGSEPVGTILEVLEAQLPAMYKASLVIPARARDDARQGMVAVGGSVRTLIGQFSAPADLALAARISAAQEQLSQAGRQTRTADKLPLPLPFAAGKPPYTAATQRELEVLLQAAQANADKYATAVARQNAYFDLMGKYAALLRQARASMAAVAASLSKPVDLRDEIDRLLTTAFDLRDAAAAYRHPAVGVAP